jgi:hypothetical protein
MTTEISTMAICNSAASRLDDVSRNNMLQGRTKEQSYDGIAWAVWRDVSLS